MFSNLEKKPFLITGILKKKKRSGKTLHLRARILAAAAILIAACSIAFYGCGAQTALSYDEDVTTDFCVSLANKDFAAAHKYFWEYAEYQDEKTFVEDCNYIVDTLKVSDITIKNSRVEENENGMPVLKYTAVLNTEIAGQISSDCSAHVIIDKGNTYIEYTRSFLLSDFEEGDMIVVSTISGKRGEIISSDGEAIAENSYADTVYVIPSQIEDFTSTKAQIGEIVELSEDDIKKADKNFKTATQKEYGTSIVCAYPHNSIDIETEERLKLIKGVYVDRTSLTPQRYYPFKNSFSHVTGYANTPSDDDQLRFIEDGGYSPSSVFGKEGLEKSYNEALLSKDGYRVAVTNENYAVKKVLYEHESTDGNDIVLTLDSKLQERTYYALHEHLSSEQTGVAIIIDYSTCAVKSMVSFPSYNPNTFSFSISTEDYERMFTAEGTDQPLFPRATLGLYPPGSIIKPFIGTSALDSGVITENTAFPYEISGNIWYPSGWTGKGITRSYDSGTPLVLKNALVKSDNIYFSWVGMKMGKDLLFSTFKKIGFEQDYSFDIPVATASMINDDTEVKEYILADMAIGHGEVLTTPLQMAALYTVFTNDGNALKPYLVDRIYGMDDSGEYSELSSSQTSTLYENVMSSASVSAIRNALRGVVTDGTAKSLNLNGRKIFAKTGTAIKQQGKDQRISWVCAWVEDEEDKHLVLVMVDGPREQDTVKFAIAKDLLKKEKEDE